MMSKFEIYPTGKAIPVTVVEAEDWEIKFKEVPRVCFFQNQYIVAEFILNNIAGFRRVEA